MDNPKKYEILLQEKGVAKRSFMTPKCLYNEFLNNKGNKKSDHFLFNLFILV